MRVVPRLGTVFWLATGLVWLAMGCLGVLFSMDAVSGSGGDEPLWIAVAAIAFTTVWLGGGLVLFVFLGSRGVQPNTVREPSNQKLDQGVRRRQFERALILLWPTSLVGLTLMLVFSSTRSSLPLVGVILLMPLYQYSAGTVRSHMLTNARLSTWGRVCWRYSVLVVGPLSATPYYLRWVRDRTE